jgi:hypothetical protein
MFRIPRVNVIESDDGFSVEMLGRTDLKYTEGNHSVSINCERLASSSPYLYVIYKSSIQRWDPPPWDQMINTSERERIINNIREAFRSQGKEIDVE